MQFYLFKWCHWSSKLNHIVIHNVLGNVMIQNVQLYVIQFASKIINIFYNFLDHLDVIQVVKNQEMLYVMLNVKNQNVKLNAQIKLVKLKIAQNVLLFVKCHTVLLIAKFIKIIKGSKTRMWSCMWRPKMWLEMC